MRQFIRTVYLILLLVNIFFLYSNECCLDGISTFIPRSQGANTARELIGWQKQLYKPFLWQNYAVAALAGEYTRSFNPCDLARLLFGTNCLTFAGSQVEDRRNGRDVIADFFGLPTNFVGTLAIGPKIENYILDFNFFFGLDEWCPGLFLRLHFPLTHTRWNLNLDDCVVCCNKFRGDDQFPQGYMSCPIPPRDCSQLIPPCSGICKLPNSCSMPPFPVNCCCQLNFISGPFNLNENCTTHSLAEALSGDFTFGDMSERWNFGRFNFCANEKTGLADVDIIMGYNLFESDFSHLALFALTVVPAGNKVRAKYIFEPIIGNGKHWELGGGLSTHISLYSDYNNCLFNASFYIEGNATHLFKAKQKRSFDFFRNGFLSRYMLLKEFDVNDNYMNSLINAINFATRNVDVTIDYKVDFSAKIVMQFWGWLFDIGYNIWARGAEKLCIQTECPCDIDQRRFGFKGTEGVCCEEFFVIDSSTNPELCPCQRNEPSEPCSISPVTTLIPCAQPVVLNSTQPDATIFDAIPPKKQTVNPSAETVCLAWNDPNVLACQCAPINNNTFVIAKTNKKPVIITCADLDPQSATQCAMLTHKIFTHIEYFWPRSCYEPHIGVGAEVEFDGKCLDNALEQWGVWVKFGITF